VRRDNAFPEPVKAKETIPNGLLNEEAEFYLYLTTFIVWSLGAEILPADVVETAFFEWLKGF
jgi:hypothetical protein